MKANLGAGKSFLIFVGREDKTMFRLLFLIGFSLSCDADIGPANLLTAQVTPRVTLDSQTQEFTYGYKLSNGPNSQQSAEKIHISVGDIHVKRGGTLKGFSRPENANWSKGFVITDRSKKKGVVSWVADTLSDVQDFTSAPLGLLRPGETLDGFRVNSKGLPSIRPFLFAVS